MYRELSVVFGYVLMATGAYWTLFNRLIARRAVANQRSAFNLSPSARHMLLNQMISGLGGLAFFILGLMCAIGVISLL